MLDVIRQKMSELEEVNQMLQQQIHEKNQLLEKLSLERDNLAESKSKNEAVISSIGEGMLVIDRKGNLVIMNEAAEGMLGRNFRELEGRPVNRTIPLRDEQGRAVPNKERPLYRALTTGETMRHSGVYYLARSDGSLFPIISTATPIWRTNRVIGAVIVFRDFTHEKEIDRAKSEFVSLASHQLRTPLTMINWYAERLLTGRVGSISGQQNKYLTEIYRGAKRMTSLVQSLLNVSRIELGTFELEIQPTNVKEVAHSVIDELAPIIAMRHLTVQELYPKREPLVQTDPNVLYIIVQNLMTNATKYTMAGGTVALKIAFERDGQETAQGPLNLLIRVTDTGLGIPSKQQKKIFNKLFRADNIKGFDTDGSGLGLYIVKSLVDFIGGKIWFTSSEGTGTSFFVLLPLTKWSAPIKTNHARVV